MTDKELIDLLSKYKCLCLEYEFINKKCLPRSPIISDTPRIRSQAPTDRRLIMSLKRKDEIEKRMIGIENIVTKLKRVSNLSYTIIYYKFIGYYDEADCIHKWMTLEEISEMVGYSLRQTQRKYKMAKDQLLAIMNA